MADDLSGKLASVEFGLEALRKTHERFEKERAALEGRADELRPEVLEHYRGELRVGYAEKARDLYQRHVARFEGLAAEVRSRFDPATLRRAAKFDPQDDTGNALKSLAFGTRLANMPPRRIAELAAEVAESGDFARAGYLQDFLESRGDAIPNDVKGLVEEKLGAMQYQGPEVEDANELDEMLFECKQTVNEIALGGRLYTAKQLESMSQEEYAAARNAQKQAGLRQ